MLLVLGILLFVLLIIVHEFGHFYAAKKSGVEVEEFGIGFPPRIYGRRFKGDTTLYSINLLPLGGFVKLKGEHDADKAKGSYGAASFATKSVIILAGVGMNLLAAIVLLTVLSFTGLPRMVDNQFEVAADTRISEQAVLVGYVETGSAAEAAGVAPGDELNSVAGVQLDVAEQLRSVTESHAGQEVEVTYTRAGQVTTKLVTLDSEGGNDGYLGVQPSDYIVERSTWSAPIRGVGLSLQFSWLTLSGVVKTAMSAVSGDGQAAAENVAGPVGILVLLKDVSQAGISPLLIFVALISVTLAVMNALPIPALDGGRLFVSALFKWLKKPLSARTEERIHATGMAVLLTLVALITFVDVKRFF